MLGVELTKICHNVSFVFLLLFDMFIDSVTINIDDVYFFND